MIYEVIKRQDILKLLEQPFSGITEQPDMVHFYFIESDSSFGSSKINFPSELQITFLLTYSWITLLVSFDVLYFQIRWIIFLGQLTLISEFRFLNNSWLEVWK
jgi:hypothetical protein